MNKAQQEAKKWIDYWISPEELDDCFASKQMYIDSLAKVIEDFSNTLDEEVEPCQNCYVYNKIGLPCGEEPPIG